MPKPKAGTPLSFTFEWPTRVCQLTRNVEDRHAIRIHFHCAAESSKQRGRRRDRPVRAAVEGQYVDAVVVPKPALDLQIVLALLVVDRSTLRLCRAQREELDSALAQRWPDVGFAGAADADSDWCGAVAIGLKLAYSIMYSQMQKIFFKTA